MYSLLLISLFSFAQQDVQISKTEKYYFAVMSWESQPYDPLKTHTFATVIHMKDGKAEQTTLSWFPATEVVRPVQILPEKGTNLSLEKSLEFATQNKLRVSLWGPFEVSEKFYDSFKLHVGKFDRGEVAYRPCSGIAVNKDSVFDCAHAVEINLSLDRWVLETKFPQESQRNYLANFSTERNLIRKCWKSSDWTNTRLPKRI